ncbi:MAG: DNA repair protein RadA [Fusobacteriaceae bacterium]
MAKAKSFYMCNSCGYKTAKWVGKCPECGEWGTFDEEIEAKIGGININQKLNLVSNTSKKILPFTEVVMEENFRYTSNISEFDRLLGGGLVLGEVVLITGNPGIGKSTLLLQLINEYTKYGDVLYISGEESPMQIKNRGQRLDVGNEKLFLMSETELNNIAEYIVTKKPKVVVVDSIQTIYNSNYDSMSGTPTQIRECAMKIVELAKTLNVSFFIVGHITKDGKLAGPKLLEHIVDAVFSFEGEEGLYYRILRSSKNRFGSTNELAVFSMEENGMREVKNSSEFFLSEREEKNLGSMVVPILEGTKVFLLEVQTLLTDMTIGIPKRVVQGYDRNRIQILTAVAEKRMGLALGMKDLFVNIPGGIVINDPSGDLGVLISLLSIYKGIPISQKIAAIGELGLRGEIRKAFFVDKRLRELEKLGFKGVYLPLSNKKEVEKNEYKLKLIYLKNLEELVERMV